MHVRLERPLEPIALEEHHTHALLVASLRGTVLGEALVPARERVAPELQRQALAEQLGDRLWEERLLVDFARAARGSAAPAEAPVPSVSVVVCAAGATDGLRALLDSLAALEPPALEVIVVDRSTGDEVARTCSEYPVQLLHEPSAALADARRHGAAAGRGEIVAFLEDDSVVDPLWLAGLGANFSDPLVMAVTGYTGAFELEPGDAVGGPQERLVHDIFSLERPRLGESNCFIRRTAIGEATSTAALYERLLGLGHRIVVDPGHIAWCRSPRSRRVRARLARDAPAMFEPAATAPAQVVQDGDPPLSVAIASYNRRERLAQVLQALAAQSYPPERYEVVVVLDGSTDGSAEHARTLDLPYRLRLLEQDNRGLAASRNRGGREAGAPVVVFLDDDIEPEPGFLAAHAAAHRGGPGVALGTCPPATLGTDLISMRMRHWWADYYRRRSEPDHHWTYVDFGDGNVSFAREVLESSGGWDEQFARETVRRQDWELGIRLLQSGVRFVDCAGARGAHHFDPSFATALRNRRVEGRSDVLLATKHPQVRGHLFLVTLLRAAAGSRLSSYGLTARHPRAAGLLLRPAPPIARLIEAAGLRSLAWRAMPKLLGNSYLAGVRDALPTREEFREFTAPILSGEAFEGVPVRLDRTGTLELPAAVGALELELGYADRPLARVEALEPEMHWDWDALEQRVVREALAPFRAVVAKDPGELPDLASAGPPTELSELSIGEH